IHVVAIIHVVRKIITAPGTTTHRKGKRHTVIEVSARSKTMRLIHNNASNGKALTQDRRLLFDGRMYADRMPRPHITIDLFHYRDSVIKIPGAINTEYRRQLFA